jgi:hypothetical protein
MFWQSDLHVFYIFSPFLLLHEHDHDDDDDDDDHYGIISAVSMDVCEWDGLGDDGEVVMHNGAVWLSFSSWMTNSVYIRSLVYYYMIYSWFSHKIVHL